MLKYVDYYIKIGWKIVPLYSKTKIPIGKGWNVNWSEERVRAYFNKQKNLNIGLMTGEILDVEGDSVAANSLLEEFIGDCYHPCYKGEKSFHHLFLNPDPELTRIVRDDIEFRAHKHQSVLPPSIHPHGPQYTWITECPIIPQMPTALLNYYLSIKSDKKPKAKPTKKSINPNYIHPWCSKCQKKQTIHKTRYKREQFVFKEYYNCGWLCRKCRTVDIRNKCRKLKLSS